MASHVIVARTKAWTLAWPRELWQSLTPDEQDAVIKRQAALFDEMQQESDRIRRQEAF